MRSVGGHAEACPYENRIIVGTAFLPSADNTQAIFHSHTEGYFMYQTKKIESISRSLSGVGTVSLSGSTNVDGGYLSVTGTGDDLIDNQEGTARINYDPVGNPVFYVHLRLDG